MKNLIVLCFWLCLSYTAYAGVLDAPTKTQDEITTEQVVLLSRYANEATSGLDFNHTIMWDLIWNNSNCTAKQMFDKLGTNGYAYFLVSALSQQVLAAADPNYAVKVAPVTCEAEPSTTNCEIKSDGTVVITE